MPTEEWPRAPGARAAPRWPTTHKVATESTLTLAVGNAQWRRARSASALIDEPASRCTGAAALRSYAGTVANSSKLAAASPGTGLNGSWSDTVPAMDETWSGGHLNDPAWWWNVAADGILSGLITALIAGGAIWVTVRHERRLAELSEARTAIAELQGLAFRTAFTVRNEKSGIPWPADCFDVLSRTMSVIGRTWQRWPEFGMVMVDLASDVQDVLNRRPRSTPSDESREELRIAVIDVASACATWLTAPAAFSAEEFRKTIGPVSDKE